MQELLNIVILDGALIRKISEYRDEVRRDPSWLDQSFPELKVFRKDMPATFAYVNLIRNMVRDKGRQPKKGDGMDFSHAVIGSAFANIVTLDGQWKRRVEELPKPNGLAKVYYAPELDQMVSDIEAACLSIQRPRGGKN